MDKNNIRIYVDAAASALKPESVIAAQAEFLLAAYANAGRGVCPRAAKVDDMVSATRAATAGFIGAKPEQIIFTGTATDGLNRVLRILEKSGAVNSESVALVSDLDHHSARLPWEAGGYKIMACPLDGGLNYELSGIGKADVFVITAMSNVVGTKQDVKKLVAAARAKNPDVITIVDAAQYAAHAPVDARDWDCDFLCFSGHKIGADTGIGVMYVKDPARWRPDNFGGGMVTRVADEIVYAAGPAKFEAGTLPLTQIVGLKAAIEYKKPKSDLLDYLRDEFSKIPQIKFISPAGASVLTFVVDKMHALDFGAIMGARGICLRVGNMCAGWLHKRIGIDASVRISVGPWNTVEEMREIVRTTKEIIK